ncbi:MAG: Transcriptional regulator, LuxR family [Nitrospira sp.]|jgi:PAS domain S-box-containing protein|nr:MAG: Transcriptional regulator, LuxR family [Nitrospira sp.]
MDRSIIAMLARTADGAMLADEHGQVIFWNRTAERLLGFKACDVLGRPCHEVMRGETVSGHSFCSPSCTVAHQLGCGGAVRHFDIRTHTKAGKVMWLNVSSLPVPSRKPNRFRFVHLFRDISKQAKARSLIDELHSVLSPKENLVAARLKLPSAPHYVSDALPELSADLPLSTRERDVLRRLGSGQTTKAIADGLCISLATVRNHIQHILEKLGAHSRLEALAIAFHRNVRSS